jgi:competence CoiA-like predicted nuclease
MTNIKLPYGLKNGEIVSIYDVESGLACECVCPACKGTLIAKKGSEKQHHFAHYDSEDCGKGTETIIHRLSKEIFSNSKSFTTPELKLKNSDIIVFEPMQISIDNVKLEHRLDDIIPDIIIESNGKELLVEIAVTHEICFPKTRTIEEKGISTIEIYAKDLFESLYRKGDIFIKDTAFQDELINGTSYKRWIYNAKLNRIIKKLKDNYAIKYERKTIKFDNYEYLNFIDSCPANKRFWKSGFNKGKSYAKIDEDCTHCEYCVGMDYKEWTDTRCEFHQHSFPITTYCCGNYKDEFQELIKSI